MFEVTKASEFLWTLLMVLIALGIVNVIQYHTTGNPLVEEDIEDDSVKNR